MESRGKDSASLVEARHVETEVVAYSRKGGRVESSGKPHRLGPEVES